MSETRAKLISEGKIKSNGYGRKGWYYSNKNNCRFFYDSALELMRMQQLDEDDNVAVWTKRHKIKIEYRENKRFIPDFLIYTVDGEVVLEETKGYDKYAEYKKEAMKKYCLKNGYIFSWISQENMKGYRNWIKIN